MPSEMAVSTSPCAFVVLLMSAGLITTSTRAHILVPRITVPRTLDCRYIARRVLALRLARATQPEDEREGRNVGHRRSPHRRCSARSRYRRDGRAARALP